jgi:hypothetical protein
VAARSKTCTVFPRPDTEVVSSNATGGILCLVYVCAVSCVGTDHATG